MYVCVYAHVCVCTCVCAYIRANCNDTEQYLKHRNDECKSKKEELENLYINYAEKSHKKGIYRQTEGEIHAKKVDTSN